MVRNERADMSHDLADVRLRPPLDHPREPAEPRTIVIRHGSGWQSLAFLCLCLLLIGVILLGHEVVRGIDRQNQETARRPWPASSARSSSSSRASPSTPSAVTCCSACATTS